MKKSRKKTRKKKRYLPKWVRAPFSQFIQDVRRLGQVVHMSARGISAFTAMPPLIEALSAGEAGSAKDKKEELDNAKKEADFAQREIDSGFSVLHAWAIVSLWAHLESLIFLFVASWLKHKRSAWRVDPIQRLRIKLGEYLSIPIDQRHVFIAGLLDRETGAGLKNGVTRFETLLEPFGLSGDLPKILNRTLYEFGQVRNVIAHRAAKVDRRFVQACPWLDVRIGTDLHVSADMFGRYEFAAHAYVTLLVCRVADLYRVDYSKLRISMEDKIEIVLANKASEATP